MVGDMCVSWQFLARSECIFMCSSSAEHCCCFIECFFEETNKQTNKLNALYKLPTYWCSRV